MIRRQGHSLFPVPCSLFLVLIACQSGSGDKPAAPQPIDAEAIADPALPEDAAGGAIADLPTEQGTPTEDEPDLGRTLEELGAVPAWQTVVDRDLYLARRGQHGVAVGVVGPEVPPYPATTDAGPPPPSGLIWLIDDTEGNGALAIKVRFDGTSPAQGDRVAVGGAWTLDDHRRWFWVADEVTPLPPSDAKPAKDAPAPPGHAIVKVDPDGNRKEPDKVKEGEIMQFTVKKKPLRSGDGWAISDEVHGELLAYLVLPGERASYGGHDLRTPDERWTLKVNQTYWVRVGRIRPPHGDEDAKLIRAVTRPALIP